MSSSPSQARILRKSFGSLSASSTASLSNSDLASEEDSDDHLALTMSSTTKEDCSDAMINVLGQLDQIVEHLRDKGENDAANGICKKCHEMLNIFNTTTATWDIETFMMTPRAPRQESNPTPKKAAHQPSPKSSNVSTWATIAATPTPESNNIVKYGPEDSVKLHYTKESQKGKGVEEIQEDSRVVWICPWAKHRPLSKVTEQIQHGPLLSIVYDEETSAVCIIFQHSYDAAQFIRANADYVKTHGQSLFGPQHEIIEGNPYPKDVPLDLMDSPTNERRRLTFARAALFTGGLTEARFRKDISDLVGGHNIELIWLFNSGNATVVFTGTLIARVVRDEFRRLAKKNGPYKDVGVSFSHDPCERPLNLITQIPGNSQPNVAFVRHTPTIGAGNGRRSGHGPSATQGNRNASGGDGGWTTVVKRR